MNIDDEAASTTSSSSSDQDSFMANSEDEEADEEIDVVGTDLGGSSARTRHCFRPNKVNIAILGTAQTVYKPPIVAGFAP